MRRRFGLLIVLLAGMSLHAAAPYPPEPVPGALVIVGGGKTTPAVLWEFVMLAGGKDKARIVVVPTASLDADDAAKADEFLKEWKDLGGVSVEILHTRDRTKADDAAFIKPLTEATAVWFSGGDQRRLVTPYRGTAVEKEFHKLLGRGGVIG